MNMPTTDQITRSRRLAGITAIASAPIAYASAAVTLSGVDWDSKIFETPTRILDYGASAANAVRLGMVLDVIGYYALLVPVLFYLHRSLMRHRSDLASIATFGGATYIIVGATGAGILSAVWPAALNDIGKAGSDTAGITASFDAITDGVVLGMWNLVGSAALAVWLFIIGRACWTGRRVFAAVTLLIATAAAIDAIATAFDLSDISSIALQVYLYGAPVWAAWLGAQLLRGREVIAGN